MLPSASNSSSLSNNLGERDRKTELYLHFSNFSRFLLCYVPNRTIALKYCLHLSFIRASLFTVCEVESGLSSEWPTRTTRHAAWISWGSLICTSRCAFIRTYIGLYFTQAMSLWVKKTPCESAQAPFSMAVWRDTGRPASARPSGHRLR